MTSNMDSDLLALYFVPKQSTAMEKRSGINSHVPRPTRIATFSESQQLARIRFRNNVWVHWAKFRIWANAKLHLGPPYSVRDLSWWIEQAAIRHPGLRTTIMSKSAEMRLLPISKTHTHRLSAQLRTSASQFLNELATSAGYAPYNVSRVEHNIQDGCKYFFTEKDLTTPFRDDRIRKNTALVFCDVDYNCDMAAWMRLFRPMLIFTFVPETITHRTSEYAYYIKDDMVHYHVSGGASYSHGLWDYSGDTVSVIDKNGDLCVFLVEQKKLDKDPNRRLVWLIPSVRIVSKVWTLGPLPNLIKRKTFSQTLNGSLVNYTYEPITDTMTVSADGGNHSVEIKGKTYQAILKRLENKDSPPLVSDVERLLRAAGDKDYSVNAPLLFNAVRPIEFKPNVVRTTEQQAHFQPIGRLRTEDGRPTGAVIGNSLTTNPSMFPTRSENSDEATVRGRIHGVRNDVEPVKKYKVYAREFLELLVPIAGIGTPISVEEVRKVQNSAGQKQRFEQAKTTLTVNVHNKLRSFMKSEPYQNVSDPRNITTMETELTIMMSTFTIPFKQQVMKLHDWYGPGKTPAEAVKRLQEVCADGEEFGVIPTDFSRMDGTVSKFAVRDVIEPAYMRWVDEKHRVELKHQFEELYQQKGTTAHGVRFRPGFGTRSGSPTTTDGNTMINAYIVYCALREHGLTIKQAWKRMGLLFGDDGNTANYDGSMKHELETVAADIGMTLKAEVVKPGDPVPYLGRYFVDPLLMGDSFADPMRTISKLHMTSNKGVTKEQALVNKAMGYLMTDGLTPIVGSWARKVLETYPKYHFAGASREELWRVNNAWPQKSRDDIRDAMAKVLDISPTELEMLDDIVVSSPLEELPVLLDKELEVKIPAIVGDVVSIPGGQEPTLFENAPNYLSCASEPGERQDERQSTTTRDRPRNTEPANRRRPANLGESAPRQGERVRQEARGNGPRRPPPKRSAHPPPRRQARPRAAPSATPAADCRPSTSRANTGRATYATVCAATSSSPKRDAPAPLRNVGA